MLTQSEADTLIAMRKTFLHPRTISLPRGADETHDLIGEDKRELFLLDLWRGRVWFIAGAECPVCREGDRQNRGSPDRQKLAQERV